MKNQAENSRREETMSIKMIALDLDRTTLDNSSRLSEENRNALEEAVKRGVSVVIATGRSYDALPEDIRGVSGIRYAVTSNGAQIRDLSDGKILYENYISVPSLYDVEKIIRKNITRDMMVETFIDGTPYIEKEVFDNIRNGGECLRDRNYVLTTRNPVENMLDMMHDNAGKVENISLFFGSGKDQTEMKQELLKVRNVTLTASFDNNLEIGGGDTSKAHGLAVLSEMLGIKREEIMACGDSLNDMAMLEFAGIAVAVANAREELKETADFVTASNNENGVAEAVMKFVIGDNS